MNKYFTLARPDTGIDILTFAKNSRNPEIIISLVIIIIAAITSKFLIVPFMINKTKAVDTRILSAIGSNNSPSFDSSQIIGQVIHQDNQ